MECVCVCVSLCVTLFVLALEPEHELFLVYGKGRPGIIRGMDMGAKVPDEHMIPIENLMNPRALDFHAETGFIYFADTTSYLIGRQKIDGTERETILKDGKGVQSGRHLGRASSDVTPRMESNLGPRHLSQNPLHTQSSLLTDWLARLVGMEMRG